MLTAEGRAGAPLTEVSRFFLSVAPNGVPPPPPSATCRRGGSKMEPEVGRGAAHSDGRLSPPGRLAGGGTMSEGTCCR